MGSAIPGFVISYLTTIFIVTKLYIQDMTCWHFIPDHNNMECNADNPWFDSHQQEACPESDVFEVLKYFWILDGEIRRVYPGSLK